MRISRLILSTKDTTEIAKFYEQLGFPILMSNHDEVRIQIGETEITFRQDEDQAFYHFAFNIPGNQINQAISWLKLRGVQVLTYKDKEVIEFGTTV